MAKGNVIKRKLRYDEIKRQFPSILEECRGIITTACAKAGIARSCYYDWREADPEFAKVCDETEEGVIDWAKGTLYAKMLEGDTTAIIFFLKCKAKHHGFIQGLEITGKNGGAIQVDVNVRQLTCDNDILMDYVANLVDVTPDLIEGNNESIDS